MGRFGEVRVAMRVVGGENDIVVADLLADEADVSLVAFAADPVADGRRRQAGGALMRADAEMKVPGAALDPAEAPLLRAPPPKRLAIERV